jgi:hypothetical protein
MALDWSNERYIRLYTRITPDMALWCWQAKAIWPWLLANAERSGTIAAKRAGAAGLAKLIGLPLDVVEAGLAGGGDGLGLIEDGCIVATATGYSIPNYADAQTAQASVNKRAADYRARQRLGESLDSRNDADSSVTENHAPSRNVTENHGASREITPSGAGPSGAGRDQEGEDPASPAPVLLLQAPEPEKPRPDHVADLWAEQERLRSQAIPRSRPLRLTDDRRKAIRALLKAGHTVDDLRACLGQYATEAKSNPGAAQYFDGVSNWRPDNVGRALGKVGASRVPQQRDGPSRFATPPALAPVGKGPPAVTVPQHERARAAAMLGDTLKQLGIPVPDSTP